MPKNKNYAPFENVNTILWDWNGTLLDDVDICVDIINELLLKRGKALLNKERYRRIFSFPVKDYYKAAGFTFDTISFEEVAVEIMEKYREKIPMANIFPEVVELLKSFKKMGFKQYVISAMEHNFLAQTLLDKDLIKYFDGISGIHNDLADGKKDMACHFVLDQGIDAKKAVFIGDTLHDLEVAQAIGTKCLLVAIGHQSFAKLNVNGNVVVRNLSDLVIQDLFTA